MTTREIRPTITETTLRPIVVLEENSDDLYLLTRRLQQCGAMHPLSAFRNGDDAIAYFEALAREGPAAIRPCAFFSDLKTLGADGFAVIEAVRRHAALAGMKIFVLTGSEHPAHKARASALGVDAYLLKFPRVDELRTLVDTLR